MKKWMIIHPLFVYKYNVMSFLKKKVENLKYFYFLNSVS